MADVWRQFRASPSAFITSHRTNVNDITQELLEVSSVLCIGNRDYDALFIIRCFIPLILI